MQALAPVTGMPYLSHPTSGLPFWVKKPTLAAHRAGTLGSCVCIPTSASQSAALLQSETCGGIQASGDSHGPGQKPPLAATRGHLVVLACHTRSVATYGGGFSPSVKTFGSQPGSICTPLTVHQATLGSITGWDKVEATGSRVSDPGSLPFPPPQA